MVFARRTAVRSLPATERWRLFAEVAVDRETAWFDRCRALRRRRPRVGGIRRAGSGRRPLRPRPQGRASSSDRRARATNGYRAEARAAAAVARKYTPDVTEVYSPNATWPAVKAALQDASLVVYMGHGNGWPSPYRDSLYPPTQDGFGLNPSAGERRRRASVLRGGPDRRLDPSRQERGRAAAPPLLRQRPVRARASRRARSAGRSSASTTSPRASSPRARRRSSPRPTRARPAT